MTPKIDKTAVCITTEKNFALAAIISSYFSIPNTYFAIFICPEIKKEDSHLLTAKIISGRHRIFITERLHKIKSKQVIFAGLSEFQMSLFKDIPEKYIIKISDIKEVEKKIKGNFKGEIKCRASDTLSGLYLAKREQKLLKIDENSPAINLNDGDNGGLVVIENNMDIDNIISINYAFSIDSNIKIIPSVSRKEVQKLGEELNKLNSITNGKKYKKHRQRIKNSIVVKLGNFNIQKYEFATFFTEGIPYGLGFNNIIPITHVMRWTVPYFIFDNIFNEDNNNFFHSALTFSPEKFDAEETGYIIDTFKKNNYYVKSLTNDEATVNNFGNYAEHFPYDILHICSHGGEVDGYYTIQKFVDQKGVEHTIEYYEVIGFSPSDEIDKKGERLIKVASKAIFKKFDGFEWMSDKLRKQAIPQYVWDDFSVVMTKHEFLEGKTIRTPVKYNIPTSCHVQCSDNIHQCQFHYLAGQTAPFVFNNSCSSWYEIAYSLLGIGARGYIGTLWNIGNKTAKASAELFYNKIFSDDNVLTSFVQMNREIKSNKYKNIYIYWGLHFIKISRPTKKSVEDMVYHLNNLLFSMVEKVKNSNNIEEVRRNSYRISKFILGVLLKDFLIKIKTGDKEKEYIQKDENNFAEKRSDNISNKKIINF
ncbi:MAG: hypothetical protein WC349_03890 [Patescibacteria group bacterium]|jgi:hypothetical protein